MEDSIKKLMTDAIKLLKKGEPVEDIVAMGVKKINEISKSINKFNGLPGDYLSYESNTLGMHQATMIHICITKIHILSNAIKEWNYDPQDEYFNLNEVFTIGVNSTKRIEKKIKINKAGKVFSSVDPKKENRVVTPPVLVKLHENKKYFLVMPRIVTINANGNSLDIKKIDVNRDFKNGLSAKQNEYHKNRTSYSAKAGVFHCNSIYTMCVPEGVLENVQNIPIEYQPQFIANTVFSKRTYGDGGDYIDPKLLYFATYTEEEATLIAEEFGIEKLGYNVVNQAGVPYSNEEASGLKPRINTNNGFIYVDEDFPCVKYIGRRILDIDEIIYTNENNFPNWWREPQAKPSDEIIEFQKNFNNVFNQHPYWEAYENERKNKIEKIKKEETNWMLSLKKKLMEEKWTAEVQEKIKKLNNKTLSELLGVQ